MRPVSSTAGPGIMVTHRCGRDAEQDGRYVNEEEALRQQLAIRMLQVLPGFGSWASSIRNFETPFGRVGLRQLSILYIMRYPQLGAESPTPGDLADWFEVQPSVITRSLARLEANGFIERITDPDDRRIARLSITPKGIEVSEYVESLFVRELRRSTDTFSTAQVQELSHWIEVLRGIREDIGSHLNLDPHEPLRANVRAGNDDEDDE